MRDGNDAILVICDIEGSSGCWSHEAAQFRTAEWARACVDMSKDVNAVCAALCDAGVGQVVAADFHRTGYNLLPELIDSRAQVLQGYRAGPVPGIGNPRGATGFLMVGMHGPSGSDGFLAHTLTSRIARLEVNGELLSEAELFASSLAVFGLKPLFISGCPVACRHAARRMTGILECPIDRTPGKEHFDYDAWRRSLARAAVASLHEERAKPFAPRGPFRANVTIRDGVRAARSLARRWDLETREDTIIIRENSMDDLYRTLVRLCYLTPLAERALPLALGLFNLIGRVGLRWARSQILREGVDFSN
jgi:D-aminopeptidase